MVERVSSSGSCGCTTTDVDDVCVAIVGDGVDDESLTMGDGNVVGALGEVAADVVIGCDGVMVSGW